MRSVVGFFDRFDFLVMPVTQVSPFDVGLEFPTEIDGRPMSTYLDWMESCWCITVTGCPAIAVPCGFTDDGLPVGLQIVGGVATISACCDWHTRSSSPPGSANAAPRLAPAPA